MRKVFVLTYEVNEYDQQGEYFVAVFNERPGISELKRLLETEDDELAYHVQTGGGRQGYEYKWRNLQEEELR